MITKRLILSIFIATAIMTVITLTTQASNKEDRFRKIGEDIVIDETTHFTLVKAQDMGDKMDARVTGQEDCTAANGNRIVYVEFMATNVSQKDIVLSSMQLSDDNHESYQTEYTSFYRCSGPTLIGNPQFLHRDVLHPGIQRRYYSLYEVSKNSRNLKIRFLSTHILDSEYALLGL